MSMSTTTGTTTAAPPRERREFWAYFEGNVIHLTGYACGPDYPGSWWCQQVGHTLTEGYQLFATEDEALRLAIREADRAVALWQGRRRIWHDRLDAPATD